jgi:hypothetical protein
MVFLVYVSHNFVYLLSGLAHDLPQYRGAEERGRTKVKMRYLQARTPYHTRNATFDVRRERFYSFLCTLHVSLYATESITYNNGALRGRATADKIRNVIAIMSSGCCSSPSRRNDVERELLDCAHLSTNMKVKFA